MTHFWLGLIAGLTIGLIVEWLFDWRAWNGRALERLRPSKLKTASARTTSSVSPQAMASRVASQELDFYDLPPAPDVRSQPTTPANKDE